MRTIYTIGHSQHKIEHFIELVMKYEIDYIIDVRSVPYSQYASQFNKGILELTLRKYNVNYAFMGEPLGARQKDRSLYSKEGYIDFSKVAKTDKFIKAINNLILGVDKNHKIALMCTEKDPMDCHRNILVAYELYKRGVNINNICEDGTVVTQEEINKQLLGKYFPNRFQRSLPGIEDDHDEATLLEKAYNLRNKEIGYNLNTEKVDDKKDEAIYHRVY
jgi:uncharacterized protein (DUF488 family)